MVTQRRPNYKSDRNESIVSKFFSKNKKYTAHSLANEYHISERRIYYVIKDWVKHNPAETDPKLHEQLIQEEAGV